MKATKYLEIQDNQKLSSYTVTETVHQEKKHLVVPVVMVVEGVLNGSHGPLLHLAEDFGKIPESWNGIPIVIQHPEQDGKSISANSPAVIDSVMVGRVYNAHMKDNKLMAEAWLEETKLNTVSAVTLVAVNDKAPIEVSVGVYTEDDPISGEWNGIKYNAIARNHRPDHLALLPGGIGACSLADGCGIRANKRKGGGKNVDRLEALQVLKNEGIRVQDVLVNSDKGLNEKLDGLRNLIRTLNPTYIEGQYSDYHYLVEAYDNYLIYEKETKDGCKYYKQNYQFSVTNGEPEFVGNPVEVEKKIEYEVINTNGSMIRTKNNKEVKIMAEEVVKCVPCIAKKATELIANKATKFTEKDRGWLETFEEADLDRMIPEDVVVEKIVEKIVENTTATKLSPEDQAALDFGKKMLAKKKADMAAGIQKNTEAGTWDDTELSTMSETMLEKLYKSTVKEPIEVDFSLNGNARQPQVNASKVEPMLPIV